MGFIFYSCLAGQNYYIYTHWAKICNLQWEATLYIKCIRAVCQYLWPTTRPYVQLQELYTIHVVSTSINDFAMATSTYYS